MSIPVPAPVRAHLAAALGAVRTTAADRWHVTLAFLGEQGDAAPLLPELADVAGRTASFELRLAGGGSFRGAAWAGLAGELEALHRLASDVAAACGRGGVRLEPAPYRPHVTVARDRRASERLAGYSGPVWTVPSFDLVRSTLGRQVRHDVLQRFPLTG